MVGKAPAATPTTPDPPLRVRVHVGHPPFPSGVPRPETVEDAAPSPVVQAMEGPKTRDVHALREPPRPVGGGARVVGQAVGSRGRLQETPPAPGRAPPLLPGVAVRAKATGAPAHGKEAWAAGQPLVLPKSPGIVRVRLPVAPLHSLALQRLGLGAQPLPTRGQGGQPRVRGPPRPPLPARAAATPPFDPVSLREDARGGHGLPLPKRLVDAPPAGQLP